MSSEGGSGEAAPAPPANFFDPKPLGNYHSTVFGLCITFLGVCYITTAARLWTRFHVTKSPGMDDAAVVLTLIMMTMGTIAFCVATRYGLGEHVYLIDLTLVPKFLLCHYLIGASYTSSTALIKISLLLQYLRIYERGTWLYRTTQGLLVFICLWGFAYTFMSWGCCLPDPSAFWNLTYKGCYGFASSSANEAIATIESHASVNMALDVTVLTLPVPLLFRKDTLAKTKWGLLVLLAMGALITSISIWRLHAIIATKAGFYPVLDPTWNEPEGTLLSFIEVYLAAICASTPVFWPVLTQQLSKIFVMYEFEVSSEFRRGGGDDEVELAPTESWHTGTKSSHVQDVRSLSGKDAELGHKVNPSHYSDDYLQSQVDPFSEEFRTEATAMSNIPGRRRKASVVRFNNPA